ncbi:hypothetical protein JCM19237_5322 [Photobacterium aphoticum]|uniref:Uncharacterized protein n=1 Tax=Photobacterium aphoticum TaxID=754436 RepID=A0A090QKU0_9GAMM|nr:hypothetical protein JCM19237_5322 [Photobacterium aphoticum]
MLLNTMVMWFAQHTDVRLYGKMEAMDMLGACIHAYTSAN